MNKAKCFHTLEKKRDKDGEESQVSGEMGWVVQLLGKHKKLSWDLHHP